MQKKNRQRGAGKEGGVGGMRARARAGGLRNAIFFVERDRNSAVCKNGACVVMGHGNTGMASGHKKTRQQRAELRPSPWQGP
jgi:hypothetical protein